MSILSSIAGLLYSNDKKVITEDDALGVNQTWQDVTVSRVAGVVYTNDTGKPIQVIVNSINATVVTITVGGVQIADASSTAAGTNSSISFIVPNQTTYQVSALGTFWSELR